MISITIPNLDRVLRDIGATPARINRATINAINRTATFARRDIVKTGSAATGVRQAVLMKRHTLQRASSKKNRLYARIIPSSAGIQVPEYSWSFVPTQHPTRARILVSWFGGRKIAAGFVNPFGQYRAPLSTRLYAYEGDTSMYIALAPSAATLFKRIVTPAMRDRIGNRLREEFLKEEFRVGEGR